MREILFRGKRIDNGKWVYGYYVYTKDSNGEYQHFIVTPKWFIVDPSTVGQYTCLTDKNDKKIFEGDIIIDSDFPDTRYVVYFNDAAYVAKDTITSEACWLTSFIIFGETTSQIIGNIHDNSELLEV